MDNKLQILQEKELTSSPSCSQNKSKPRRNLGPFPGTAALHAALRTRPEGRGAVGPWGRQQGQALTVERAEAELERTGKGAELRIGLDPRRSRGHTFVGAAPCKADSNLRRRSDPREGGLRDQGLTCPLCSSGAAGPMEEQTEPLSAAGGSAQKEPLQRPLWGQHSTAQHRNGPASVLNVLTGYRRHA